jgi:DNA-directed RNA polymerase subunit L
MPVLMTYYCTTMPDGSAKAGFWKAFGPFRRKSNLSYQSKRVKATQFSEFLEDEKMETGAFLTNITSHLNQLNVKLQGRDNTVCDMITAVQAFQKKFELFKNDLQGELVHIPNLLVQTQGNKDVPNHVNFLQKLMDNFKACINDFNVGRELLILLQTPFLVTNVTKLSEEPKQIFRWVDVASLQM